MSVTDTRKMRHQSSPHERPSPLPYPLAAFVIVTRCHVPTSLSADTWWRRTWLARSVGPGPDHTPANSRSASRRTDANPETPLAPTSSLQLFAPVVVVNAIVATSLVLFVSHPALSGRCTRTPTLGSTRKVKVVRFSIHPHPYTQSLFLPPRKRLSQRIATRDSLRVKDD